VPAISGVQTATKARTACETMFAHLCEKPIDSSGRMFYSRLTVRTSVPVVGAGAKVMALGALFIAVWFFGVALYLVRQYVTSELAAAESAEPVPAPIVVAALEPAPASPRFASTVSLCPAPIAAR